VNPIVEKIIITVIGILITSLAGWLSAQIVKYKKLIKKEEDETVKNTIVSTLTTSLEPIKTDISVLKTDVGTLKTDVENMKDDIGKLQTSEVNFTTRLNPM
jgi:hypothetical protein